MNIKLSLTNVFLIVVIMIIGILYFNSFSEKRDLNTKISSLQNAYTKSQETNVLYQKTKNFIKKSSEGKQGALLTGSAKKNYDNAIKQSGRGSDESLPVVLDRVDINNIFIVDTQNEGIKAYAIYRVYYKNNPNGDSVNSQRVVDFTLVVDWVKEHSTYKVSDYQINLLQDSLDKQLRDMKTYKKDGGGQ